MTDLPPRMAAYRDLRKLADEFGLEARRVEVTARRFGEHSNLRARMKARALAFRHCEERVLDAAGEQEGALPPPRPMQAVDPEIAEPGAW